MKKSALFGLLILICPSLAFATTSLEDSVRSSLVHSKQLSSVQASREASAFDLKKAKSGFGPQVNLNSHIGASYLNDESSRLYNAQDSIDAAGEIKLSLSQPLWDGGRNHSKVKIASERLASLDARVIDNATSIALDTIIAHININRSKKNLEYAMSNVAVHENILYAQKQRLDQGVSTKADLDQTKGRLARANSTLADSRANVAEAEQEYFRLTGQKVENLQSVITLEELDQNIDLLMDMAITNNPKLVSYSADTKQMAAQIELAKANYHPTIGFELTSRYSNRSARGENWLGSADAMLVFEWNLYSNGANKAEENAAKSRYRQAQDESYNLVGSIYQEIANTLYRHQTAKEQYAYYSDALKYNDATYNGFFEQFKSGERSLLDVLDAENERFSTRVQLESAEANINIAYFKVKALIGVLLGQFGIDNPSLISQE